MFVLLQPLAAFLHVASPLIPCQIQNSKHFPRLITQANAGQLLVRMRMLVLATVKTTARADGHGVE